MEYIAGRFEIAAGSITGRDHLRPLAWKNNQDGFSFLGTTDFVVAIVTDGCGGEPKSEVGAMLGAELFTEAIALGFYAAGSVPQLLENARQSVLRSLMRLLTSMPGRYQDKVFRYFLFTVNGILITGKEATMFAIGDGVQIANGTEIPLGPFPGNAPPYAAYSILDLSEKESRNAFQITKILPADEVQSILIGTDGVLDLIQAENETIPGRLEHVGPISQFWEEDRYFKNPDAIRRRLAQINNEFTSIDWKKQTVVKTPGRLHDDTTFVVIRRVPGS